MFDTLGYDPDEPQTKGYSKAERARHAVRPRFFDDDARQATVDTFDGKERDLGNDIEQIADLFKTIYHPARQNLGALEDFKARFELTDQENTVYLNEVKAANKYARLLTDVFVGLPNDQTRYDLENNLLSYLKSEARADQAIGKSVDVDGLERNYRQMMTGIKLDSASMAALEKFSDQYGWDVRSSTIDEDVENGVDAYTVRRADGVSVPIDFKSDRSFQKQPVREKEDVLAIEGIKVKSNKRAGRVLVVNSQGLGQRDKTTGKVLPIKKFRLSDEHAFAEAVNQAVQRW
jgi:hypothetical protein